MIEREVATIAIIESAMFYSLVRQKVESNTAPDGFDTYVCMVKFSVEILLLRFQITR